ncbi:MAG TPA: DUF3572 domain-containing protein [Rhizomicrobium sp.]|nr:DUF3572 domain-containing protein [Rhizomicrobium sp.]
MRSRPTTEEAQILALKVLGFIVNSEETLRRFVELSGVDVATLRARADSLETHIAVLDFLLADEGLLVAFCETASVDAKMIHMARYVLGGS